MSRVLCFGELLLRLSPQLGGAWIREHSLPVYIGGAELNTATALARWGVPVSYCTVLPDHYLAREVMDEVAGRGIDTGRIQLAGGRIGTYYLPQGADLKNAAVIYDRAYSSFSELKPGQLDWDQLLQGVDWFHFSAISPALNEAVAEVCREGASAAAQKGITVSVDLNYRSRLWQYGKEPHEVMPALVEHCDLVMGNIWAAEKMLSIPLPDQLEAGKTVFLDGAAATSRAILEKFPRCRQVANTFRFDEGRGVRYFAALYTGSGLQVSAEQEAAEVVDKIGSGDTFMAGLIWGNMHQLAPKETVDFAAAAAFQKLFIRGDATTASVEDVRQSYIKYA